MAHGSWGGGRKGRSVLQPRCSLEAPRSAGSGDRAGPLPGRRRDRRGRALPARRLTGISGQINTGVARGRLAVMAMAGSVQEPALLRQIGREFELEWAYRAQVRPSREPATWTGATRLADGRISWSAAEPVLNWQGPPPKRRALRPGGQLTGHPTGRAIQPPHRIVARESTSSWPLTRRLPPAAT
jgi:hypothetical protein